MGILGRMGAFLAGLSVGLVLTSVVAPTYADPGTPQEYQVKAAFLYNFAKFVGWPAEAFSAEKSPIVIGVLGEDPFGSALPEVVQDKTVNGKALITKHVEDTADAADCHILFVGASERRRLRKILDAVERPGLLTVGDVGGFAAGGGVIQFVMVENKVRFEINTRAAERAGLKISSKLLSLARLADEEDREVEH